MKQLKVHNQHGPTKPNTTNMDCNILEASLLLIQSILVNSLLWSAEAWSGLTDKQLPRLETVDTSV